MAETGSCQSAVHPPNPSLPSAIDWATKCTIVFIQLQSQGCKNKECVHLGMHFPLLGQLNLLATFPETNWLLCPPSKLSIVLPPGITMGVWEVTQLIPTSTSKVLAWPVNKDTHIWDSLTNVNSLQPPRKWRYWVVQQCRPNP